MVIIIWLYHEIEISVYAHLLILDIVYFIEYNAYLLLGLYCKITYALPWSIYCCNSQLTLDYKFIEKKLHL